MRKASIIEVAGLVSGALQVALMKSGVSPTFIGAVVWWLITFALIVWGAWSFDRIGRWAVKPLAKLLACSVALCVILGFMWQPLRDLRRREANPALHAPAASRVRRLSNEPLTRVIHAMPELPPTPTESTDTASAKRHTPGERPAVATRTPVSSSSPPIDIHNEQHNEGSSGVNVIGGNVTVTQPRSRHLTEDQRKQLAGILKGVSGTVDISCNIRGGEEPCWFGRELADTLRGIGWQVTIGEVMGWGPPETPLCELCFVVSRPDSPTAQFGVPLSQSLKAVGYSVGVAFRTDASDTKLQIDINALHPVN